MKKIIIGLFVALFLSTPAFAATYYARTDGGTSSQCTGTTNAAYDGAGTGEACAFNHPAWALGATGTNQIMSGGDTLQLRAGDSFMIGYGMPNTVGCSANNRPDCMLKTPPSGTVSAPTRILGSNWNTGCSSTAELWGTEGVRYIFNLNGVSNLEMQCLEVTDHSNCGMRTGVLCTDWNSGGAMGTWAAFGIFGHTIANLKLQNLDIHGIAGMGVNLGGLTGVNVVNNTNVVGNYFAGFDGDTTPRGGPLALMYGNLTLDRTKIKFNGCQEAYPRTGTKDNIIASDYGNCTGNENQGYGEGFSGGSSAGAGVNGASGNMVITNSDISNNTSDGVDFLYASNNFNFYMDKTITEGNAGNQLKITGKNIEVTNSFIGGNCSYHPKSNKVYTGGPAWGSTCRSGGVPIAITPVLGTALKFRNISFFSADDADGSAILEISNNNFSCNGTETYDFKNMIAYNQVLGFWGSGNGFYNVNLNGSCQTAWDARTVTYSKIYGWGSHPGTGNTYTAPAWVGAINNAAASNKANVLLTSNVGGGNASTYWNTSTDINNYRQNSSIDQGAFQYGTALQLANSGQACVADTDCLTGDCTNFACSGSCTTNGGACADGSTCCSGYCNGSSVCATPTTCGDGTVQPTEVCDGSNLNGSNCILQGFTGGSLSCASDCLSFVTSSCNNTTVFPLTPVLDAFTRANGAVGTNFNVYSGGFNITSNAITPSGGAASSNIAIWSLASFTEDQEAYIKMTTKGSNGDNIALYLRGNLASLNSYVVVALPASNEINVYRLDAGSATQLGATISQSLSSGDSVGASIVGSTITVYYKASAGSWTALTTRSDSTYSTGSQIGFGSTVGASTADIVLDDFGGGSLNPITCGNGVKEGSEVCDGADLAGQSCTTQGFASGTLSCASNCSSFVTSSCTSASTCGNNTKEINEACDGTDLDNHTCITRGFASGTLGCNSNCQTFNTLGCVSTTSGVRGGMTIK